MKTDSPVYRELDKSWKSTCRILFKREIGGLGNYQPWLASRCPPIVHEASALTGKDISYAITDYCPGSKRASLDEIWKLKKFPPLSINEIKDMDSLLEAVGERAYYTGNVILGNSANIESSSNCNDSHFVLESGVVSDCKRVGNCSRIKGCEHCFGCDAIAESQFMINAYEAYRCTRCLEAWKSQSCSDCMYVNGLVNSTNCMFCFNVKNKKYAIGNLELEKGKYSSIKEKLVSEISAELEKGKSLPSLSEIVGKCKGHSYAPILKELEKLEKIEKADLSKIDAVFSKTTEIVLGKKLSKIADYSPWLTSHVLRMELGKSIISKKPLLLADYSNYLGYPRQRLVTLLEAEFMGSHIQLEPSEAGKLSFSAISDGISEVAYLSPELIVGMNDNVNECSTEYTSMNSYRSPGVSFSKNTAYSFWPRNADCIFGSSMAFESFFCINSYYSEKLNRCFEVDSSKSCSDSYYLHNCENVNSSLFCFNAKNLSYAVGNTPVGKEQFGKAKAMLLEWINEQLEKKKEVPLSIFNVGCRQ